MEEAMSRREPPSSKGSGCPILKAVESEKGLEW